MNNIFVDLPMEYEYMDNKIFGLFKHEFSLILRINFTNENN